MIGKEIFNGHFVDAFGMNSEHVIDIYDFTELMGLNYPNKIVLINAGDKIQLQDGLVAETVFTLGHNPSCIKWIVDHCILQAIHLFMELRWSQIYQEAIKNKLKSL